MNIPRILSTLFVALALVGLAYLATLPAIYALTVPSGSSNFAIIQAANTAIGEGLKAVWALIRPLVQLAILLFIVSWFLERLGISLNLESVRSNLNVQAVLAVLVVSSFCLAALIGFSPEGLKEVTLVIVGFYFGSRLRERDPDRSPVRTPSEGT